MFQFLVSDDDGEKTSAGLGAQAALMQEADLVADVGFASADLPVEAVATTAPPRILMMPSSDDDVLRRIHSTNAQLIRQAALERRPFARPASAPDLRLVSMRARRGVHRPAPTPSAATAVPARALMPHPRNPKSCLPAAPTYREAPQSRVASLMPSPGK